MDRFESGFHDVFRASLACLVVTVSCAIGADGEIASTGELQLPLTNASTKSLLPELTVRPPNERQTRNSCGECILISRVAFQQSTKRVSFSTIRIKTNASSWHLPWSTGFRCDDYQRRNEAGCRQSFGRQRALIYIAARVVGRILGGWIGGRVSGADQSVRRWIGLAMMPQAGVALGMALVASSRIPELRHSILPVAIGSTIIFELSGPVCTRIALRRCEQGD